MRPGGDFRHDDRPAVVQRAERDVEVIEPLVDQLEVGMYRVEDDPVTMTQRDRNGSGYPFSLAEKLERITEPERQVRFTIEPGLKDNVDPRLIRALLENLLGNAWKYTRKTPEAQISFVALDINGERVYCIRDNGAGFDMEKSDQLFEPFQRLHASGEFSGTGVGLATVKRIVERHGGRVWGEGAVGRGASFFFTLR